MKEIKIGEKSITLDIGEELRVKDLRKIQPVYVKHGENYLELIIGLVEVLSPNKEKDLETLDTMTVQEFAEFTEELKKATSDEQKKTKQ